MTSDPNAEFQAAALDRPAEHVLDVPGGRLHYLDWGNSDAPAMVLLHGMAANASEWARVAAHYQRQYHVVALDQRGYGDSSHFPEDDYDTAHYVADLETLIDALSLDSFVLVGHSMGGHNALAYTARHPEHVRCLVVNDIGPSFTRDLATATQRFPDREQPTFDSLDAYIEQLREDFPNMPDWALVTMGGARLKQREDGRWQPKADAVAMMYWNPQDVSGQLAQIACPTLIIRATQAEVLSDQAHRELVGALPAGEAATVNSGHATYMEAEDAFFAAVDPFLARHAPGQRPPEEQR